MVRHSRLILPAADPAAAAAVRVVSPRAARIVPVLAPGVAPGSACPSVAGCPARGPRLFTASALLRARPRLAALVRAAGCEVRAVERWAELLDVIEDEHAAMDGEDRPDRAGAVLVDLDGANRAAAGGGVLSGNRLVALLARRARAWGFTLVVQTACDYSEIEDVVRLGHVGALPHPDLTDEQIAAQIQGMLCHWEVRERPRADAVAGAVVAPRAAPAAAERTLAEAATWAVGGWPGAGASFAPPALG